VRQEQQQTITEREGKVRLEVAREEMRVAVRHLQQAEWNLRQIGTEDIARITLENLTSLIENIRTRIGR
jgi:hypothetical protein